MVTATICKKSIGKATGLLRKENLPVWFRKREWEVEVVYHTTSMLPPETGLIDYTAGNFDIRISGAARAMMECLYLADDQTSLKECYELMEGLNNLVPQQVEALLKQFSESKTAIPLFC